MVGYMREFLKIDTKTNLLLPEDRYGISSPLLKLFFN